MLLKNERRLLHILRKEKPDYSRNIFTYEHLEDQFYRSNPEDLYQAVRSLTKKGEDFIGIAKMNNISFGVFLESAGTHYGEYIFWQVFSHVFRFLIGVIVGIFVGVFGTLISEYLVRLLFR